MPSEGHSVAGKVLNLSHGGCGIETVSALPEGTLAEIVLRVNTASIRVLGEVRAISGSRLVGVMFVQVSGSGKYLLGELIHDLATVQALGQLRRTRRRLLEGTPRTTAINGNHAATQSALAEADSNTSPAQHLIEDAASRAAASFSVIVNGVELNVFF